MRKNDHHLGRFWRSAKLGAWWRWLRRLHAYGRERVAAVGLTLILGFVAGFFALYIFAELAGEVMEGETRQFDRFVLEWLQQFESPSLDQIALGITLFGSEIVFVFMVVLLVIFGFQQRWAVASGVLLTTAGATALNSILKSLFERPRPVPVEVHITAQEYSFPSGHAMVSASFYFYVAYLGWRILPGWWRVAWGAGFLLLVILIGLTRLYLGVHFLTDIVAGYLAGLVWTVAVVIALHMLTSSTRESPE